MAREMCAARRTTPWCSTVVRDGHVRNLMPAFVPIAAVLLAVSSPLRAGSAAPDSLGPDAAAAQPDRSAPIEIVADVCETVVRSRLPPPCPCDGINGLGCEADRASQRSPVSIDPLPARAEEPFTVRSTPSRFDPHPPCPPPRHSS